MPRATSHVRITACPVDVAPILRRYLRGKKLEVPMLLILAIVLLVLWLLGFLAFHVTSFAIHLLLLIGLVMLVMHFVRRPRTA